MPVMAWHWPVKTLIVPSGLGPCAPELGSGSTAPVRTSKQEVRSCTCLGYAPQCPPLRHAWEDRLLLAPGEAGISWQIHPSVNTEVAKGILSHVHPPYHTQGAWVGNAGRDFIEESKGQKLGKVNRRRGGDRYVCSGQMGKAKLQSVPWLQGPPVPSLATFFRKTSQANAPWAEVALSRDPIPASSGDE